MTVEAGRRPSPLGDLALLLCAVGWGATFPVTRLALEAGATPLALNAVRFLLAAAVLLPLALRRGAGALRRAAGHGLALGSLIAVGFWLQAYGLQHINSSRSAFLTSFYVLFTPALEWLVEKRRPAPRLLLAAAVATAGLAFMAGDLTAGAASLAGDIATLACAGVFAVQMVLLSIALAKHSSTALLFLQIAGCGVLSSLAVPVLEASPRFPFTTPVVGGVAFLALGATVVLLGLQNFGQKRTTASRAAVLFSSEPVWAVLFALAAGETVTGREVGGGALVIAALLIASLGVPRPAPAAQAPGGGS